MLRERRRHRAETTEKALDLSLCAAARTARVAGVVLSDSRGLLVASSIKGPAADLLAAAGAQLAASGKAPEFAGPRLASRMVARHVRVDRQVLCLCAAGEPSDARAALRLADAAVRRILRPAAQPTSRKPTGSSSP
jgi:hypothetical protein